MTRLHEVNRAEAARAACDSYHTHVVPARGGDCGRYRV